MTAIVEARQLTKSFRRPVKASGLGGSLKHLVRPQWTTVEAVRGIDLTVQPGESVAYVGPNGAGKSTTIKLLTGILVPTSGSIRVAGVTPHQDRVANSRNISVLFGQRTQLWWDLPVIESLRLLGDIYQVPAAQYRATVDELVDVLDLSPLLSAPARQLSLGQRMRCDLAAALVHAPQVLFLDEPTIGLDVSVKAKLREFISRMLAERGLTLLLTSHDIGDIEELCPRMVMIDEGRIVFDGAFNDVTRRFGWEQVVTVTLADEHPDPASLVADTLGPLAMSVTDAGASSVAVSFDSRVTTSGELVSRLVQHVPVSDLAVAQTSAESIVRRLYERDLHFDESTASSTGGGTA